MTKPLPEIELSWHRLPACEISNKKSDRQDAYPTRATGRCAVDIELRPRVATLIERHDSLKNDIIAGFGHKWGWRDEDIRDAQQDGVFAIIEAIQKFQPSVARRSASLHNNAGAGRSFQSFLCSTVIRRFLDYARKRIRREKRIDRFKAVDDAIDSRLVHRHRGRSGYSLDGDHTDPAEIAEHHETVDQLHEGLTKLNESERLICELRCEEGLSEREIAAKLGLTRDTVKKRWEKAIKKLRDRLVSPDELAAILNRRAKRGKRSSKHQPSELGPEESPP